MSADTFRAKVAAALVCPRTQDQAHAWVDQPVVSSRATTRYRCEACGLWAYRSWPRQVAGAAPTKITPYLNGFTPPVEADVADPKDDGDHVELPGGNYQRVKHGGQP